MPRKVTVVALALACALLLAPAGATAAKDDGIRASSQQQIRSAALFSPLTAGTARRLALRLSRTVARDRNVRWWTLSPVASQSDTRIVFLYTDRSRDNVFCTSEVVVSQPHRRFRKTTFENAECAGVPREALAMESAAARFIRTVRGNASVVNTLRSDVVNEVADCENLRVPRSRRTHVRTLFAAWETQRLVGAVTKDFTLESDLEKINPQNAALAPARQHWLNVEQAGFGLYQTLIATGDTEASESPCRALKRWARSGWTDATSPAYFGDLRTQLARYDAAVRGLTRVARALVGLGVSSRAASAFLPEGVIAVAVPEIITCQGRQQVGCAGSG